MHEKATSFTHDDTKSKMMPKSYCLHIFTAYGQVKTLEQNASIFLSHSLIFITYRTFLSLIFPILTLKQTPQIYLQLMGWVLSPVLLHIHKLVPKLAYCHSCFPWYVIESTLHNLLYLTKFFSLLAASNISVIDN